MVLNVNETNPTGLISFTDFRNVLIQQSIITDFSYLIFLGECFNTLASM